MPCSLFQQVEISNFIRPLLLTRQLCGTSPRKNTTPVQPYLEWVIGKARDSRCRNPSSCLDGGKSLTFFFCISTVSEKRYNGSIIYRYNLKHYLLNRIKNQSLQ